MLTPEQLDQFPDNLVTLYGKLEADIIADISRRLARYDYFIPSAEFQYKKALEMGNIHDEILKKMESLTGKRKREIEQLMKEAGYETIKVDDEIYQLAGLKPKPISQSPALLSVLNAGINNTNGLFENLTRTTASTTTKQFERALDRAFMQITSGAFDYETAIRGAVKSLSETGIASIEYPSGRIGYLESAVRRAALTGVNQTALKLQEAKADEMGCDLVETSAHEGARPSHAVWQGKVFSRSGNHPKYPNFREVTGYGTGAGLGGWNCRHNFYPFFEGVSKRAYTNKELKDMQAQNYEYKGKKMTEYEATQKQRYIESQIRRWKREYNGMEAAGLSTAEASAKISRWNNTHDDFLRQTGLKRQSARLQVVGFGRSEGQRVVQIGKKITAFNSITGTKTANDITVTTVSRHFGQRAIQRKLEVESIKEALTNPLKIGKIQIDKDGRKSQRFIGEGATVNINPDTGELITSWKTGNDKKKEAKNNDSSI